MFNKLAVAAAFAVLCGAGVSGQVLLGAAYVGPVGPATLYAIAPATGAALPIGSIGARTESAMALAPNGVVYGVGLTNTGFALLNINTTTGAGTIVGLTGVNAPFQDMDFRPSDGKLFGYSGGSIYTINIATGVATFVGDTGKFPFGNALAFSPSNILYSANESTLDVINQTNGSVTSSIPLIYLPAFGGANALSRANAMKFHPNGRLLASVVTDGAPSGHVNSLAFINVASGEVNRIGTSAPGLDALSVSNRSIAVPIPAPSSWLLVSLGIVCVVMFQLFRKTRRAAEAAP